MRDSRKCGWISGVFVALMALVAILGMSPTAGAVEGAEGAVASQAFLESLVGSWQGNCRTWFRPGELADESEIKATFQMVLGGNFLRHTYQGGMQGKPRTGEETITFNGAKNAFQATWVDSFHMNYGIMFSEGKRTENGFSVIGTYAVGEGQPDWSWRTEFALIDKDHLTITAYNILPNGQEGKAVETVYVRQ